MGATAHPGMQAELVRIALGPRAGQKVLSLRTVELDAGHLSLVSHAQQITELILAAAGR